jgi:hypothetical protein
LEKTYLEFGSINKSTGEKNIYDTKFNSLAYDWFMLARYANDLITLKNMNVGLDELSDKEIFSLYNNNMHHLNDASKDFYKLLALSVIKKDKDLNNNISFYEFGQTIYGCIEGMEFYLNFLIKNKIDFPEINLKQINWYGIDISELFNELSILFHPNYKIKTAKSHLKEWKNIDVFFAKGVTLLYGIKSAKGFFDLLNNFSFATFDYSLSLGKSEIMTLGTGKKIKYLSFKSFQKEIAKTNKELFVQVNKSTHIKEKNRIRFEAIYGDINQIEDFIYYDKKIKDRLFSKYKNKQYTKNFLNFYEENNLEWKSLEAFVDNL